MKWMLLGLFPFVLACSQHVSAKGVIGNYDVMISQDGKSDPDVLTILTGSNNVLLLTFIAGITTDPDGPNPSGLRASLGGGDHLTIAKQPAHIDHSTGELDGTIAGEGQVVGFNINLTLHYLPTNFAIGQQNDPDGGIVLSRTDMGLSATLDYSVTGMKEM